jgi:methanethiol S-methyltransferase
MPNAIDLIILALAWVAWGGLHSLLLADGLRGRLQAALHMNSGMYRLLYSIFSLITIYPVIRFTRHLGGISPFFWPEPWLWLQLVLLGLALFVLLWSGLDFSKGGVDLMGLKDAFKKGEKPHELISAGAYAHLRHPMHLAALIMVWARSQGPADLVVSLLMTIYLVLGTWHEEARLRRQFGQAYRDYAKQVPLVPFLK